MKKSISIFETLPRLIYNHHIKIILFSVLMTIVSAFWVKELGLKTDIAELLPKSYKSVSELEKIKQKVGGVGSLIVAVEGQDFEKLKQAALILAENLSKGSLVKSVEYLKDRKFLKDNALIFADLHQLNKLGNIVREKIDTEKLKISGMYVDIFDDDSEEDEFESIRKQFTKGSENAFYTNKDKTIIAMQVYASGTASALKFVRKLFAEVEGIVDASDLQSIDPDIEVLYSGSYKSSIDQNDTIISDLYINLYTTLPAIILFVSFYFMQPGGFIFIFIPLAMSIFWTFGLTEIIYDDLNTITAFLFIILFGMGIDYGIHSFARYLESRRDGDSIQDAIHKTVAKTGRGIFTSAMTTSVAFFTLMFNDFRGFSQFGFICGFGIASAYIAMTIVFPAFLIVFDKIGWIRTATKVEKVVVKSKRKLPFSGTIIALATAFTVIGLTVAVISFTSDKGITFEYDFKELRSNLPKSKEMAKKLSGIFAKEASSPAIILSDSKESSEEIVQYIDKIIQKGRPVLKLIEDLKILHEDINAALEDSSESKFRRKLHAVQRDIRKIQAQDSLLAARFKIYEIDQSVNEFLMALNGELSTFRQNTNGIDFRGELENARELIFLTYTNIDKPTVKSVITLHTVVPDSQNYKMAVLTKIENLINSDKADLLKGKDKKNLDELKDLLAKRRKITLKDLPEKMVQRFIGKDGSLGEFVFIIPGIKLRDGREAMRFSDDIHEINLESGKTFYASSPNIVIADMLRVLLAESKVAVGLAMLAVFGLVFIDVRSLKATLLILTPLVTALLWLGGIMYFAGLKFNFFNMVVLPSIIGIGIDNGVHIYHRYKEEGPGSAWFVLKSTGLPVIASVVTTMLGFLGLVFAQHNGLNSIGDLAVIGLSMTLLAAITLLPAIFQKLEKQKEAIK